VLMAAPKNTVAKCEQYHCNAIRPQRRAFSARQAAGPAQKDLLLRRGKRSCFGDTPFEGETFLPNRPALGFARRPRQ